MLSLFRSSFVLPKLINEISFITLSCQYSNSFLCPSITNHCQYLKSVTQHQFPIFEQSRSIFIIRSGDMLWEGVTGAPGKAKKRARGKRRVIRKKVDLNLGRKVGENKENLRYPGLNYRIIDSGKHNENHKEFNAEDHFKSILELRNKQTKQKHMQVGIPPLRRGWTGSRMGGQSLGPPIGGIGYDWSGFDSRVLELKVVTTMTGTKGRLRRFSALVMVGDGRGLVGEGKARATNMRSAMFQAKKRATERLEYFNLKDNRTVFHPDFEQQLASKVYIKPLPENAGLTGHRVIQTICRLVGIRDLYAKIEGSVRNPQVVTRAFLALLRRQKSYQQLADQHGLLVVQRSQEFDNYPRLLAEPRSIDESNNEAIETKPLPPHINFDNLHTKGAVFVLKKFESHFSKLPKQKKKAEIQHRFRNLDSVKRRNLAHLKLAEES